MSKNEIEQLVQVAVALAVLTLITTACEPASVVETESTLVEAESMIELTLIGSHRTKYIYRFVDREMGAVRWMAKYGEGIALSCLPLDSVGGR